MSRGSTIPIFTAFGPNKSRLFKARDNHDPTVAMCPRTRGQRTGYPQIIRALFQFYFRYVTSFDRIRPCTRFAAGNLFPPRKSDFGILALDASFANDFNKDFEDLRALTRTSRRYSFDYETILYGSHCIRWASCASAVFVGGWAALLIGTLQFVLAPFSFPIALMKLATYGLEGVVHYSFAMSVGPFLGGQIGPVIAVNAISVGLFFVVDQLLNLVIYLCFAERLPLSTLVRHVVYGTANTKLYYVVVFGCLWGQQIDLMLVMVVSAMSLAFEKFVKRQLLNKLCIPCAEVRFFMDHRLGHLPVVYEHAHKQHHHLNDCTPWDAHTYGNGMNEHYFLLLLDVLPCLLAPSSLWTVPYFLNFYLLHITWLNKPSHTRSKPGGPLFDNHNFHADHHVFHIKNYSLAQSALLDYYFDTQAHRSGIANGIEYTRHENEGQDDNDTPGKSRVMIEVSSARN